LDVLVDDLATPGKGAVMAMGGILPFDKPV